ncbi:hypothetical protein V1503_17090 [Bacillus sp. SCS-151]|uniref:YphA family membrane protein n=1 Tax=Nanhaiella sioensis TaxID=3115293 RepID=UPI00397DF599
MEGQFFYWFFWSLWVIATFCLNKSTKRLMIAIVALLTIILSVSTLKNDSMSVSYSYVMLLVVCYAVISKKRWNQQIYTFISMITITFAYVSFHLFELFDPVWVLFDRKWMLTIPLVYVTFMLAKNAKDRVVLFVTGLCHGELLYFIILQRFNFYYEIGSLNFLDVVSIGLFLIMSWAAFEYFTKYFDLLIHKNIKEKQG